MSNWTQRFRTGTAILAGKTAILATRLTGSGGTSLPGKLALKIQPQLLEVLGSRFDIHMVTGTNGKTTTSRILARLLELEGIPYATNKSGANLASGLTTTLIASVGLSGQPRHGVQSTRPGMKPALLLETDEAAFRITAPRLKPKTVVVTNFFRDQLDRFGELYTTLKGVREGIAGSPGTTLILNADDSLCASLGLDVPNDVLYYGLSKEACSGLGESVNSDAAFCLKCSTRYVYEGTSYGHLGHFRCPACGYARPDASISLEHIIQADESGTTFDYAVPTGKAQARVILPGSYNVYNAMAGIAFGHALGVPSPKVVQAVGSFECGFGRMETIQAGTKSIQVILVKNPTGFNQVLHFIRNSQKPCTIGLLINDQLADGTDVSWLWDVDFEVLPSLGTRCTSYWTGGLRGADMAVRLKYAGIPAVSIHVQDSTEILLDQALASTPENGTLFLMPTYTALLALRGVLKKRYGLKAFWK